MTMWTRLIVVAVLAVAASAGRAETAQETFDQIFGAEAKQAKSAGPKEQLAFARKLLAAAKETTDDPGYSTLLCSKVLDWAMACADGYEPGVEAAAMIAGLSDQAEAGDKRLVELMERHCHMGSGEHRRRAADDYLERLLDQADAKLSARALEEADAILKKAGPIAGQAGPEGRADLSAQSKRLGALRGCMARVETLKAALQKNPQDARAARDLVLAMVLELGDVRESAAFVEAAKDAVLAKMIPLAAKTVSELNIDEAMEIGEWYRQQSSRPGDLCKRRSAERALECFENAQGRSEVTAVQMNKAKLGQEEMEKLLASLDKGGRRAIDLLRLIDPKSDAIAGKWKRTETGLLCEGDRMNILRANVRPPAEYDVRVQFTRVEGAEAVTLVLARGDTCFVWGAGGWNNMNCGLGCYEGKGLFDNLAVRTRVPNLLTNGKRYTMVVQVRRETFTALLDGKKIAEYKLDYSKLSAPAYLAKQTTGCVGVGAGTTAVVEVHKLELIEVTGRAKVVAR